MALRVLKPRLQANYKRLTIFMLGGLVLHHRYRAFEVHSEPSRVGGSRLVRLQEHPRLKTPGTVSKKKTVKGTLLRYNEIFSRISVGSRM